jgi:hypothetical protein
MAGARSRWWVRRDTWRLLSRAEFSNGKAISDQELTYMRAQAEMLLAEILPLSDGERQGVWQLHHDVMCALCERAGELDPTNDERSRT